MIQDTLIAYLGAGLGVIGTALGVINTVSNVRARRVRLRIKTAVVLEQDYEPADDCPPSYTQGLIVDVVNLGPPVTVTEVGLKLRRGAGRPRKIALDHSDTIGEPKWQLPAKMGTGETLRFPVYTDVFGEQYNVGLCDVRSAYALTACGKKFTGRRELARFVKNEKRSFARSRRQMKRFARQARRYMVRAARLDQTPGPLTFSPPCSREDP